MRCTLSYPVLLIPGGNSGQFSRISRSKVAIRAPWPIVVAVAHLALVPPVLAAQTAPLPSTVAPRTRTHFDLTNESAGPAGSYEGVSSPADPAHRTFQLRLLANGEASLKTFYGGPNESSISHGHWTENAKSVILSFDALGINPPARPITFRRHHNMLVPQVWDVNEWGRIGPPIFHRDRTPKPSNTSN